MIVFSSVSKSFADQSTAIVDLNLEVNPGDLVVITGPSGSGKTTLMKLLIREYSPSSGKIVFDGRPLEQFKKSEVPKLRRQIGVVFQDYKLIEEMNAWENIALPLYIAGMKESEIESRVTDLLNLIGLADKALLFPRQLSGGEAQRVSIARALATAPKVIFADEPTGNLDSEASLKITKLLKKINELGTTVLFATHDEIVIQELAKAKVVHLDKPSDEEGQKVKVKQEKLAKEMAEKKQTDKENKTNKENKENRENKDHKKESDKQKDKDKDKDEEKDKDKKEPKE